MKKNISRIIGVIMLIVAIAVCHSGSKAAAYPYGETGLLYRPCVLQLHTEMLCPHRPENRKDNTSRCRTDGYVYPYV